MPRSPLRLAAGLRALAVAAAAGAIATPGAGARTFTTVNVSVGGSLSVTWTSPLGAGCSDAGLCGLEGALQVSPTGSFGYGGSGVSARSIPLELSDTSSVVRVADRAADGSLSGSCVDVVPVDMTFTIRPGSRRATAGRNGFLPASAGRCAGPTAADLARLSVPVRRAGAHGYDLSGRTSFTAGPFTVEAVSDLHARVTVQTRTGSSAGGPGPVLPPKVRVRRVLQESAELRYRVAAVRGSLATSFSGSGLPGCRLLGACGARGALQQSFRAGGTLFIAGNRIVKRRIGRAGALADLIGGRLGTYTADAPLPTTTTETVDRAGAPACADTAPGTSLLTGRGRTPVLVLEPGNGDPIAGIAEALRTRCPGPGGSDILGGGGAAEARGAIGHGRLGARRLTVTLSGAGAFSTIAYAGRRSGAVTVTLVRVGEGGGTHRIRFSSVIG